MIQYIQQTIHLQNLLRVYDDNCIVSWRLSRERELNLALHLRLHRKLPSFLHCRSTSLIVYFLTPPALVVSTFFCRRVSETTPVGLTTWVWRRTSFATAMMMRAATAEATNLIVIAVQPHCEMASAGEQNGVGVYTSRTALLGLNRSVPTFPNFQDACLSRSSYFSPLLDSRIRNRRCSKEKMESQYRENPNPDIPRIGSPEFEKVRRNARGR